MGIEVSGANARDEDDQIPEQQISGEGTVADILNGQQQRASQSHNDSRKPQQREALAEQKHPHQGHHHRYGQGQNRAV